MNTRQKVSRGVAVVAMVAAVAACSSSKHGTSSTTSVSSQSSGTSASSTGQATGAPIKVGIVCTCSGAFGADIAAAEDTYKSWVNTVNGSGGINGHPISLTLEDDAANPGTSSSQAQTLISDHVDAIVDLSIVDETWASAVQQAGIPVVGANETETPFYQNPDFFSEGQTNDSVTYANVATAKLAGATNLGDLYCAEAVSCQEGVSPLKAAGQKLGVPDVYNGEISATAPNYTAQCLAAKQAKVSGVFIGDEDFVIAKVAKDCDTQGFDPIWVTEGEGFGMVMASTPGLKDKLWSDYQTIPFFASIPAVQQMNAAVDKYYSGLRNNQQIWTQIAAEGWASGILLEDAVKGGGLGPSDTPSSAEILKGLYSLHGDTLQGMAPPLTYKQGQPNPVDCWFTGRVQGGTPSVVNNGQVTCMNGSSSS